MAASIFIALVMYGKPMFAQEGLINDWLMVWAVGRQNRKGEETYLKDTESAH